MSKEYDQITAFHYSAFRPSLHAQILDEYFGEEKKHNNIMMMTDTQKNPKERCISRISMNLDELYIKLIA